MTRSWNYRITYINKNGDECSNQISIDKYCYEDSKLDIEVMVGHKMAVAMLTTINEFDKEIKLTQDLLDTIFDD